jgi:hypothetical protein
MDAGFVAGVTRRASVVRRVWGVGWTPGSSPGSRGAPPSSGDDRTPEGRRFGQGDRRGWTPLELAVAPGPASAVAGRRVLVEAVLVVGDEGEGQVRVHGGSW